MQFMTLVLVDGDKSGIGPYEDESPWNLNQTQWVIDLCWVFRIDRYFRTSFASFMALIAIWQFFLIGTIALGVTLSFKIKSKPLRNFLTRVMKIFMTLQTSIFFIPMIDTYTFALRCTLGEASDECLGLDNSVGLGFTFIFAMMFFFIEVSVISLLYYDVCFVCGGTAAKPHPRFKILRYFIYIICIMSYYFITVTGKVIMFLIISLVAGGIGVYTNIQYVPYFNKYIGMVRLGSYVAFTSAVFCMLIGEFFKSTDQTNSSVSMLFYFLTPCLMQISWLAMFRRGKTLRERKM